MKGSDPEIFIVDNNNICIPPIHLLINDKIEQIGYTDKNRPVFYKDSLIKIIEDGAAFEFNTKPTDNAEEYFDIITHGIEMLSRILYKVPYYKIVVSPVIKFNLSTIVLNKMLLPQYEYACRFGCDPDIDIYSGKYSAEIDAKKIKHRFGGGHIHISSDIAYKNMDDVINQVKLFDILIGNAFVVQSKVLELEKMRQKFYGRPGKIRLQNYENGETGIEYRTPSNSWITNLDSIKLIFESVDKALELYRKNNYQELIERFLDISINNILTFNKEKAKEVLDECINY